MRPSAFFFIQAAERVRVFRQVALGTAPVEENLEIGEPDVVCRGFDGFGEIGEERLAKGRALRERIGVFLEEKPDVFPVIGNRPRASPLGGLENDEIAESLFPACLSAVFRFFDT